MPNIRLDPVGPFLLMIGACVWQTFPHQSRDFVSSVYRSVSNSQMLDGSTREYTFDPFTIRNRYVTIQAMGEIHHDTWGNGVGVPAGPHTQRPHKQRPQGPARTQGQGQGCLNQSLINQSSAAGRKRGAGGRGRERSPSSRLVAACLRPPSSRAHVFNL